MCSFPALRGSNERLDSTVQPVIQCTLSAEAPDYDDCPPGGQSRSEMEFDVDSHLGEVARSVAFLERDGQQASAVTLSRTYATTVDDLWDAVTNAERFPRWFAPVSGELELGGGYQVEGNAAGQITACQRPSHYALTWEFAGDVSWVEVSVAAEETGARISLTHTALLSPHWDTYGPGAVGVGWEMATLGLAFHIADPGAPRPEMEAFATSRDGRAFISGSSDGWAGAAVAAGTDDGAAGAAARRTTAFYTGEPEPTE